MDGVPSMLQPVAHALLDCADQVHHVLDGLTRDQLAARPGDIASLEFHVRHLCGSLDRLFTYARGEALSDGQREYLAAEKSPSTTPLGVPELLELFDRHIADAIERLKSTSEASLGEPREVGRAKLPSTTIGLLFHGAEHTARHTGQIVTTAKLVRALARGAE